MMKMLSGKIVIETDINHFMTDTLNRLESTTKMSMKYITSVETLAKTDGLKAEVCPEQLDITSFGHEGNTNSYHFTATLTNI